MITNGDIDLIVNSPVGKDSIHDDSYLRKAAIKQKPLYDYLQQRAPQRRAFRYVQQHGNGEVMSLQEIHDKITDQD